MCETGVLALKAPSVVLVPSPQSITTLRMFASAETFTVKMAGCPAAGVFVGPERRSVVGQRPPGRVQARRSPKGVAPEPRHGVVRRIPTRGPSIGGKEAHDLQLHRHEVEQVRAQEVVALAPIQLQAARRAIGACSW